MRTGLCRFKVQYLDMCKTLLEQHNYSMASNLKKLQKFQAISFSNALKKLYL